MQRVFAGEIRMEGGSGTGGKRRQAKVRALAEVSLRRVPQSALMHEGLAPQSFSTLSQRKEVSPSFSGQVGSPKPRTKFWMGVGGQL